MEFRLLWASLWRRRGMASLAALAVAIGASVAAALMHVSGDVGAKLTHELRSLGPNLVIAPAPGRHDLPLEHMPWIRDPRWRATPVLFSTALARGHAIPLAGADLAALAQLHPSWRRHGSTAGPQIGASLAKKLGVGVGDELDLTGLHTLELRVRIAGEFDSGSSDDEALWLPLADVMRLTDRWGFVSLVQGRVDGGTEAVDRFAREHTQPDAGYVALPLHALSAAEQGLLDRMRRLMLLVTLAALVAGALSAYGTLTDLALERKREIALLKAVGAPRRWIVGRFLAESIAIGVAGCVAGWVIGAAFALYIGREVFHATLTLRPSVPPTIVAIAVGIALLAAAGPIRLALSIEPARALREDG
jgi:putative ABC transport system permease protein